MSRIPGNLFFWEMPRASRFLAWMLKINRRCERNVHVVWMSRSSFLVTRLGMSCKPVVSMLHGIISTMFSQPQSCFLLTVQVVHSIRFLVNNSSNSSTQIFHCRFKNYKFRWNRLSEKFCSFWTKCNVLNLARRVCLPGNFVMHKRNCEACYWDEKKHICQLCNELSLVSLLCNEHLNLEFVSAKTCI